MAMTFTVDNDGKVLVNGLNVGTLAVADNGDGTGALSLTLNGATFSFSACNLFVGLGPDSLCNVSLFANVFDIAAGQTRLRDGTEAQNILAMVNTYQNTDGTTTIVGMDAADKTLFQLGPDTN